MVATPDLIELLAADAVPVRRLRPPLLRAGLWLAFALFIAGLVGVLHGVRPELGLLVEDTAFDLVETASLATAVLAAIAAFYLSLPDRSSWWLALPAPPFILWSSMIGYDCLTNWIGLSPDSSVLAVSAQCFAIAALTSLPLSLLLMAMLRHAAFVRPIEVTASGALAVGAFAATAISLLHGLDATAMILLWNLGTAVVFVLGGSVTGRWLRADTAHRASCVRAAP
jgi:hypothetical protein